MLAKKTLKLNMAIARCLRVSPSCRPVPCKAQERTRQVIQRIGQYRPVAKEEDRDGKKRAGGSTPG